MTRRVDEGLGYRRTGASTMGAAGPHVSLVKKLREAACSRSVAAEGAPRRTVNARAGTPAKEGAN